MANPRICSVVDCGNPVLSRGFCGRHYYKVKKSLAAPYTYNPPGLKKAYFEFLSNFVTDDCVVWPFDRSASGHGRLIVSGKWIFTHIIVAEARLGPRPTPLHQVAHNCGNASCMNYAHLRWATAKENQADRILHGTAMRGSSHHRAVLSESDVLEIRHLKSLGINRRYLAKKFGITPGSISDIVARRCWAHI